jgi:exopolysaccharide/PEP-CTERM locus tyrosine autokinase
MNTIAKAVKELEEQQNRLVEKNKHSTKFTNANSHHVIPSSEGDADLYSAELRDYQLIIDAITLRTLGLAGTEQENQIVAEQFRVIKRPLLKNVFHTDPTIAVDAGNLIGVTSSLPNEGKTFVSFNLAASIANEPDHTVVLIDADLARRDLTTAFGLEDKNGLLDLLLESECSLNDVTYPTSKRGLFLLPSGAQHPQSTELLSSRKMRDTMSVLSRDFSQTVFIFDSAPLMASTESLALIDVLGQIVLVIEADATPLDVIERAIDSINTEKPINLILNKCRFSNTDNYGLGYYGYRSPN